MLGLSILTYLLFNWDPDIGKQLLRVVMEGRAMREYLGIYLINARILFMY